jgi:uncharacterized protein DUF1064
MPFIADMEAEAAQGRRHKFSAKRTDCPHGHSHPSKREAKRCAELHLLFRAGEIGSLVYEPEYNFVINGSSVMMRNGHKLKFTPDFGYTERGKVVVEDVKGMMTADARVRHALFRHMFPDIELRVVR